MKAEFSDRLLVIVTARLFDLSSPVGWVLPLCSIVIAFIVAYWPSREYRWIPPLAFLAIYPILFFFWVLIGSLGAGGHG